MSDDRDIGSDPISLLPYRSQESRRIGIQRDRFRYHYSQILIIVFGVRTEITQLFMDTETTGKKTYLHRRGVLSFRHERIGNQSLPAKSSMCIKELSNSPMWLSSEKARRSLICICISLLGLWNAGCLMRTDQLTAAQTSRSILTEGDTTLLGFSIGKTSLMQVSAALGKAEEMPRKEQDARRICYMSISGRVRVIFEAGPMGGWQDITAFTISTGTADSDHLKRCVKTAKVSENIATASGLRLGMSRKEIKKRFGDPASESIDHLRFVQHSPILRRSQSGRSEELIDSSYVDAWFQKDQLVSIRISRFEST